MQTGVMAQVSSLSPQVHSFFHLAYNQASPISSILSDCKEGAGAVLSSDLASMSTGKSFPPFRTGWLAGTRFP